MTQNGDDFEVRKIRKNGQRYEVTPPKWWAQPASEILNARIMFERKDGKLSITLVTPSGKVIT